MTDFDPLELAEACRSGRLYPPRHDDLARFGERGLWQAGVGALRAALAGWWVGEADRVAPILADAVAWLSGPEDTGRPWGEPALTYEAHHRHARALVGWMTGRDEPGVWELAATTFDAAYAGAARALDTERRIERSLLAAMAGIAHEPGTEAVDALATAKPERIAARVPALLAGLLDGDPGLVETTLMAFAFGRVGGVAAPSACPLFAYVLLPSLPLPPGLAERGWADAHDARVALPPSAFAALGRVLTPVGLARDADATPQPALPRFASWTRHPALDLEVDWHAPEGRATWIEIRGEAAGRLAGALATALDGRIAPDPQAALAEMLTPPPTIPAGGNAALRWDIITVTLAGDPPADRAVLTPLVAAGLADTDWRVRMVAVWAVGALALSALATAAAATPLPAVGEAGLNADDRRTLLALRDAAVLRAAGRIADPATNEGAGSGGARRARFVARMGELLDDVPVPPKNRSEALVAALLRRLDMDNAFMPSTWKEWAVEFSSR